MDHESEVERRRVRLTRTDISKYDNNWRISLHNRLERPDRQFRWLRPFRDRLHRDTFDLKEQRQRKDRRHEQGVWMFSLLHHWFLSRVDRRGDRRFSNNDQTQFSRLSLVSNSMGFPKWKDERCTCNKSESRRNRTSSRSIDRSVVLHHSVPKFSWRWFAATADEICSKRTVKKRRRRRIDDEVTMRNGENFFG